MDLKKQANKNFHGGYTKIIYIIFKSYYSELNFKFQFNHVYIFLMGFLNFRLKKINKKIKKLGRFLIRKLFMYRCFLWGFKESVIILAY
jgi:hypothetical protein